MRQYGQDDLYVGGKPAVTTPAVIKTFQVISDFTYKYKAYDPTFLANWFADFPNNRVGMVLAGTWFAPAIRGQKADVRFGVAPHPVVDPANKDSYANIVWSWLVYQPEQRRQSAETRAGIPGLHPGQEGRSRSASLLVRQPGLFTAA